MEVSYLKDSIIKKALGNENKPIEEIIDFTGLTKEEILKLK